MTHRVEVNSRQVDGYQFICETHTWDSAEEFDQEMVELAEASLHAVREVLPPYEETPD